MERTLSRILGENLGRVQREILERILGETYERIPREIPKEFRGNRWKKNPWGSLLSIHGQIFAWTLEVVQGSHPEEVSSRIPEVIFEIISNKFSVVYRNHSERNLQNFVRRPKNCSGENLWKSFGRNPF